MKVNVNKETAIPTKKVETIKQSPKKEEFKKVLYNHEKACKYPTNTTVAKLNNKESDGAYESGTVVNNDKPNINKEKDTELNSKESVTLETLSKELQKVNEAITKQVTNQEEPTEEMLQIQQLLQTLMLILQNPIEDTKIEAKTAENEESFINPVQLLEIEKPTSSPKDTISSKISEIVEMLEKSKVNVGMNSQIIEMLKKITNVEIQDKTDLDVIKTPIVQVVNLNNKDKSLTDNYLKDLVKNSSDIVYNATSKNQMQNSSDTSKDTKSSGNSSFEEKFLSNFLTEDKDEVKISKVVNFMNQFESAKTINTAKVETPIVVIDKSNIVADAIKTIKFMEINNIKDLTVKMNPKELGEITIKIIVESGIMKASLSAQNKETYNLLNQNMQEICDKLKNMDIKIQSLDINIYEDSTFFNKNSNSQNDKNNNQRKENNSKVDIESEEDITMANNSTIEQNQVNKFV